MIAGKKPFLLLLILLGIVFAVAAYWILFLNKTSFSPSWDIIKESPLPPTLQPATNTAEMLDTSDHNTKTYRNEEWRFEFEYPEDWTFEINSFYSPSSKFNLQGNSSAEDYNPLIPSFLINIVTPDFVTNQFSDVADIASEIFIGGVRGLKYEYETQYGSYKTSNITVIFPLGKYKMILRMHKEHENTLNQILSSFKFLK